VPDADDLDYGSGLVDAVHNPARSADDLPDPGIAELRHSPTGLGKIQETLTHNKKTIKDCHISRMAINQKPTIPFHCLLLARVQPRKRQASPAATALRSTP